MTVDLIHRLSGKWVDGAGPRDLYERFILASPEKYLPTLIAGLSSGERRVQSGCAEILTALSEDRPGLVYPHVDIFLAGLDASEPVLRWESVATLGNLASVDSRRVVLPQVDSIAANLASGAVLQGHSVRALGKIARANPTAADSILQRLLSSTELFPGNRVGFLIESMENFLDDPTRAGAIRDFVEPYAGSEIGAVATKARRMLRVIRARLEGFGKGDDLGQGSHDGTEEPSSDS